MAWVEEGECACAHDPCFMASAVGTGVYVAESGLQRGRSWIEAQDSYPTGTVDGRAATLESGPVPQSFADFLY